MAVDYHKQRAQKNIIYLRQQLEQLPDACRDFIRALESTASVLTRLAYAYDLKIFFDYLCSEQYDFTHLKPIDFNDKYIGKITQKHIEMYMEYLTIYFQEQRENDSEGNEIIITRDRENGEQGKMRKLSSLRSFFHYMYRSKRIKADVSTLIDMPKLHQKPILRLNQTELQAVLEAVKSGGELTERQKAYHAATQKRDTAIITLFLGTGIRVSECVGLNLEDIDLKEKSFIVTRKGGNQVILYFPDEVRDALSDYISERKIIEPLNGNESALFLSLQRKRITQRAVENLVKKYCLIAAPLKSRMSPHKLRSTFGTNLYLETGDIYLVADVLGHSSVETTRKHYADMTEDRRREAAKAVRLPTAQAESKAIPEEENRTPAETENRTDVNQAGKISDETDSAQSIQKDDKTASADDTLAFGKATDIVTDSHLPNDDANKPTYDTVKPASPRKRRGRLADDKVTENASKVSEALDNIVSDAIVQETQNDNAIDNTVISSTEAPEQKPLRRRRRES